MLGNGSGGVRNDPNRNLTTITPATTGKPEGGGKANRSAKKQGAESGKLDRIDRDEVSSLSLEEVRGDDERQRGRGYGRDPEEELEAPAGHASNRRRFKGQAFRVDARGRTVPPTFGDVDQGNLSDAWLMACFAAVAHAQPAQIMKRIDRLDDGAFQVRVGKHTLFRITPEFSGEGYADPMPNGQEDTMWCALLEKAWAKREAGAYTLLEVGNPSRALEDLSGKTARRISISDLTAPELLWTRLREARLGESAIVYRTREQGVATPLHADHVYAVLDVYERDGNRVVRLYNPWGTNGNERTLESMIHEIGIAELIRDGLSFHVSG
ncbi:MAG: hypothetical protein IPG45_30560 [Deltaproteobacteria bacterium]|jgi:hypothetical protein|nr:hypothetical protein [Deltaproteobacteria bacterium]